MDLFNLILVLPDRKNEKVLAINAGMEYRFPKYDEPVGDNVGFDEPQIYNDFLQKITGIPVFRKYTFNTQSHVVFVFEQIDEVNGIPLNGYEWIAYDNFINTQKDDELRKIAHSVRLNYNKSVNMPWVNAKGFSPYFAWLQSICAEKNIRINGKITQVKNAYVSTVFCVPTDTGNLYMKIPGKVYIHELPFTHELMKIGMTHHPIWVDFNLDMNVVLMKDMGGNDLPPQPDMASLQKVVLQLSKIQKDSLQYLPLNCDYKDYRINTILENLNGFPEKAFKILSGTRYEISHDETKRLERNIESATKLLKSVMATQIPNTIQHGDVRPGNIRVIADKFIFYDWSWGAVSHPFIEISLFLHVIRRNLPVDVPAKEILVDIYLREWLEYGTYDELKNVFSLLDDLKELYMAYSDYYWVETIHSTSNETIDIMSADGWLLERRNYYFARVLKGFIDKYFDSKLF